ncbi:MAG: FIST C-terminal domain-containing protein [Treponema sp.]|jgi:hypothetical protein|nr:FIST C-terminal domain-containing protein [Treponema sp.]
MISVLSAYTRELDDPEKAVREILRQLNMEKRLLKYSAALLFCHAEFIELGVMQAVCKSLPCAVIGCTSQGFAMNGAEDEILLTLNVLTSSDTEFAAGLSQDLDEDAEKRVESLYQGLTPLLPAKPSLIFAIQPRMLTPSGDILSAALDRACGGVPVFGACALDEYKKTKQPKTIFNGASYGNRIALLLFSGPVQPRFFSALFPEKEIFPHNAIITGAEENKIYSINNMPALLFFEGMGDIHSKPMETLYAIPLVIDYHSEKKTEVVVVSRIDADGSLICSRNIKRGGVLNIGAITAGYVIETAGKIARSVKTAGEGQGLFIFSCFSRNVTLGGEPMAEIETIKRELAGFSTPWTFLYSCGELCPQYAVNGKPFNRFIQYSLIACLL